MPYRKRDIQENRPPIRPHCPHFVFLLFMAIPHERKLAHLLQIEESVTHFFFPSLEKIPSNDIQKFYNFWWHPDFLPLLAHILTWKPYSSLIFCTQTMQYTQVKPIILSKPFQYTSIAPQFHPLNHSIVWSLCHSKCFISIIFVSTPIFSQRLNDAQILQL